MKLKKILALMLSCMTFMFVLASCGKNDEKSDTKNTKSFTMTLYPEHAPITCENFEKLVGDKFYDGLTFHRVVQGFMAQGGDPKGDGTGGADPIKGEFKSNGVENTLSHTKGVVSMARRGDSNDSGSCQFFICYDDVSSSLDGDYAAFGKVTKGMEVVDGFLDVERKSNAMGELAVPVTKIKIVSARMIDKDADGNPQVEFKMSY